ILSDLTKRLVPLARQLTEKTASWPDRPVRSIPEDATWTLCRDLLTNIGFDFERGHLDRATHPSTTALSFDDVRLALRPHNDDISEAILTTLHEGGHGLYDQGFADADRGTMLAQAPSMGLHESQARLWENHVGRSSAFWQYFFPKVRSALGDSI